MRRRNLLVSRRFSALHGVPEMQMFVKTGSGGVSSELREPDSTWRMVNSEPA